jgi:mRNA interferase MazF
MNMIKSGMTHKQGDIILVPFPFSDLSGSKRRPALVISNNNYNARGEDIVTCGVTSNPENREYSVVITNKDLSHGSLLATSRVKADKLFTVKKSTVIKTLATVSERSLNQIKDQMLLLFNF